MFDLLKKGHKPNEIGLFVFLSLSYENKEETTPYDPMLKNLCNIAMMTAVLHLYIITLED